jgi:hypothetical protein
LEVWNDAKPFQYECKKWLDEPAGFGVDCKNGHQKHFLDMNQTRLIDGLAQSARQHRLIVKDGKKEYYNLLLAFEDDMLVTKTHVEQHLKWSRNVQQLLLESKTTTNDEKNTDWRLAIGDRPR